MDVASGCVAARSSFRTLRAQVILDWDRDVYSGERPHRSLGYRTPVDVAMEAENQVQN